MSTRMRVPRVIQEFFPSMSGPANQALALAAGLERCGVASPVLTTTPAGPVPRAVAALDVQRFAPWLALPQFRVAPTLYLQLLHEPASLLHVHCWRNPAADSAIMAARRRGLPLVVQAHGVAFGHRYSRSSLLVSTGRQVYETLARRQVLACADAVVASTRAEAVELRDYGFAPERIAVIPAGVAASFFAGEVQRQGPELTLLSVGRLSPRRNLEQIIDAVAQLWRWGLCPQLRIVGPDVCLALGEAAGYQRTLEARVAALGLQAAVTFVGERRGAELLAEYRAADVFVYASRYENFGQPLAEAAAAGLPLVSTAAGVASELLADGSSGVLAPFGDAAAMAALLLPLCREPQLRWRMGAAARRYAAANFDWQCIVPRYLELYQHLLTERRRAAGTVGLAAHQLRNSFQNDKAPVVSG